MHHEGMPRRTDRAAGQQRPGKQQQEVIDTMHTSRTRLVAISAATLALVVAGTASVAAQPGDRDDQFGYGLGGFGRLERRLDMRGQLGGMLGAAYDRFVRSEVTYEADDGFVTQRVDNGTIVGASETGVEYTLADGQSASVSTDEDTQVFALSVESVEFGRRGLSRQRLVRETVEMADIEAGSEVTVWATSQDDGSFLAQRIVVRPDLAEAADDAASEDADAADDASEAEVEASPATDA